MFSSRPPRGIRGAWPAASERAARARASVPARACPRRPARGIAVLAGLAEAGDHPAAGDDQRGHAPNAASAREPVLLADQPPGLRRAERRGEAIHLETRALASSNTMSGRVTFRPCSSAAWRSRIWARGAPAHPAAAPPPAPRALGRSSAAESPRGQSSGRSGSASRSRAAEVTSFTAAQLVLRGTDSSVGGAAGTARKRSEGVGQLRCSGSSRSSASQDQGQSTSW